MKKPIYSCHPYDDEHYEKLGLKKDRVEPWEDGLRTEGIDGDYEWWYSDFTFTDGTKLVIVFYTKNPVKVKGPMKPLITMELTLPDGRKFYDQTKPPMEDCSFSKEGCDVVCGESSIRGELKHYDIIFKGPKMTAGVTLDNTLPAWRSGCGNIFFGDNEEHCFAWLPAVPEGRAEAEIAVEGETLRLTGSGYHDHNWGDISMFPLMHHWYWGRAKIGDYKVIASWITAEKKYGYNEFDIFMLAKGSEIIGDNSNHTLKFLPENEYIDEYTGKPVFGRVVYEYETPVGEQYRVSFEKEGDLAKEFFYESLPKSIRGLARFIGFRGSYQRFTGTASVERIEYGGVAERATEDSAVWELMYFGKAGADTAVKK